MARPSPNAATFPGASKDHVLIVNHYALPPSVGGGTRHAELGRYLADHSWSVTIAASDFHYQERAYMRRNGPGDRRVLSENVDGVLFRWLWAAPYSQNNWRRGWNWISFAKSVGCLHDTMSPPTVIIGSSPHLFAAHAAERLARRWGIPFVLEVRDLWPESLVAAGGRAGPAYLVLRRLARSLYARADRIIVLTRGVERYLRDAGISGERLVYVPNGVDAGEFPVRAAEPEGVFRLIYAGAHGPANGLETVLEAAARLRGEDVEFVFVGNGPSKPALMQRAEDEGLRNVVFRPPVPKRDMPSVLAQASAGLMVLREAPLFQFAVSPNKLFDYYAAGLPVVTNVGGEVGASVSGAGAGIETDNASSAALARAVRKLAQLDSDDRRRMGLAGRAWVTREHDRPALARRLAQLLDELKAVAALA